MVLSNTLLKRVLTDSGIIWEGKIFNWLHQFILLLKKPLMWYAITAFISANLLWVFILSSQKMNIAYPLQITLVFALTTIVSLYIFEEKLNHSGIIGLVSIIIGIILLIKN
jgi:multidrug transporter EmrE-like cation transporter